MRDIAYPSVASALYFQLLFSICGAELSPLWGPFLSSPGGLALQQFFRPGGVFGETTNIQRSGHLSSQAGWWPTQGLLCGRLFPKPTSQGAPQFLIPKLLPHYAEGKERARKWFSTCVWKGVMNKKLTHRRLVLSGPSQVALHPCLLSLRSLSRGLKGINYNLTTRSPSCCILERAPNLGRVGRAHIPRTLELGGPGKEHLIVWSRLVGKPQVTISTSPPPTLPSTFNISYFDVFNVEKS